MKTFWNNEKFPEAVEVLNANVPKEGPVMVEGRPMLEAWRKLSNGYYDIYNNGGCNWDIKGPGFRAACRAVGIAPPSKMEFVGHGGHMTSTAIQRLETIADAVFVAALAEKVVVAQGPQSS